jgi:hypothetical protein
MKWLLFVALAFVAGCHSTHISGEVPAAAMTWGPVNAGLRMAVWVTRSDTQGPEAPQIHVGIENVGDSDVVLNLGSMFANVKIMHPLAIALTLTDGGGTIRQLQYDDPPVAGRVDDYLVALRAGSTYTLRLPLNRYSSPATNEYRLKLRSGHYRIEASFTGWDAKSINADTTGIGLLNFWKSAVRSSVVDLRFD